MLRVRVHDNTDEDGSAVVTPRAQVSSQDDTQPGDPADPADTDADGDDEKYPAYVEFTVRMNVESAWEFETLRRQICGVARAMSTVRLHGDEAALQVLWRQRPGVRPIASDPQDTPPFTFEHCACDEH